MSKPAPAKKSGDHWKDTGAGPPEERPGPYAQDRSRTPPTKEQRERDYDPRKTGKAAPK
jgi:hypothetical protein